MGKVCFVDEESGAEEEGDNEGGDENGRIPTLNRGLGE
jgi:hypothetical protein